MKHKMKHKVFELRPIDGRKSFYGKAIVAWDMQNDIAYLYSYGTIVATYYINSGVFHRVWFGYSATTMRHVNAFRSYYGLPPMTKAEWNALSPYM